MDPVINTRLVRRLISQQFPNFSELPIQPVVKQGHDNRTFRLGERLSVRLPSTASYADAVQKEATVLTSIGRHFSIQVPEVCALGQPSDDFPLPWSIRRWLPGGTLEETQIVNQASLARALGDILVELRSLPADTAFLAGRHSFFRGCHLKVYHDEVMMCLSRMDDALSRRRCLEIWNDGLKAAWSNPPVWFHGDLAVGNILINEDKISALIDFGICGVGDPSCDLAIAWTYFDADTRRIFKDSAKVDDGTWSRGRCWALWKALISLNGLSSPDLGGVHTRALNELLDEAL
ncbi:aminoglycoside phosphotransferase family protein [Aliiroseovarius sp. 2305UL8-7]|uniref:aminoglycoside phosphotransferase family protein n=1 Tax=Aliiroseovarius conchicola TaxID=3121637 RepID=UPI003527E3BC